MEKTININWKNQTAENIKILASLGFKPPKKRRKAAPKHTNLKETGVPIQIQRRISCSCCKSITIEFVTSYVRKELVSVDREAITDCIRNCKKCREVLLHKTRGELAKLLMEAHRNYVYK